MKKIVFVLLVILLSNLTSTSNQMENDLSFNQNNTEVDPLDIVANQIKSSSIPTVVHDGIISPGEYGAKVIIDAGLNFELYYYLNHSTIYIALVADTTGYVAIGFGSNMGGSDYAIGYYSNGVVFQDGFGPGGTQYQADTIQNILSAAASENATSTIFEFSRYLDTGDTAEDTVIQIGSQLDLIWAISSDDSFGYHSQRGYATITFNTFGPLAPKNVIATPGDSKVDLNWNPSDDGGSPITQYNIYRSTTPGTYATPLASVNGNVTSYSDTTAINGENYSYVLTSVNVNGESEVSEEVQASPGESVSPPLNLQALVSDGKVNLTWQLPLIDGGSPIISYNIYRSEIQGGPFNKIGTNTSITGFSDSSVINGNNYWYVVTANNTLTESDYSNEVKASPIGRPPPPRYVTAVLGIDNITISWNVPVTDGGFPITNYSVYRSEIPGGPYTFLGINSTQTGFFDNIVLDLKTYYFVVTASNSAGESTYSSEITVKFAKVPFAPENLTASTSYGLVKLNWTTPFNNGFEIIKYNLYRSTVDGGPYIKIGSTNTTEYIDLTVSNGQIYYYIISAENIQGEGGASIQVSALPGSVPGIPNEITTRVKNSQVHLSWLEPQITGGFQISNYRIYRSDAINGIYTLIIEVNITQFADNDVINGQSYFYSISATNIKGEGNLSQPVEVIPGDVPSIPQDVSAYSSAGMITLNWSESDSMGYDIIAYRVYRAYVSEGQYTYLGSSKSLQYNDNSSIVGISYYYVITSVNALGESNYSQEVMYKMMTRPSAPQNLIAISNQGQVGLAWNIPVTDGGSFITHYIIYRSTSYDGNYSQINSTAQLIYIDSGLQENQTYYYKVTAINDIGESNFSDITSVIIHIETISEISDSDTTTRSDSSGGLNLSGIKQIFSTVSYFASVAMIGGTIFFLKKVSKGNL